MLASMSMADKYRELARRCRDRAMTRSRIMERETMLGAAAEFDRLAANEERAEADMHVATCVRPATAP